MFDVGDDSVLIVRAGDGEIKAFHNSCRHRGTRLADPVDAGTADSGAPRSSAAPTTSGPTRLMARSSHAVAWTVPKALTPPVRALPVASSEVGGLIFVRLGSGIDVGRDAHRDAFADVANIYELAEPLEPQGLERSKVAHVETIRSTPAGKSSGRTTVSAGTATSVIRST